MGELDFRAFRLICLLAAIVIAVCTQAWVNYSDDGSLTRSSLRQRFIDGEGLEIDSVMRTQASPQQ